VEVPAEDPSNNADSHKAAGVIQAQSLSAG
jgi:hypothetical protein